jgi:hypothetical protein
VDILRVRKRSGDYPVSGISHRVVCLVCFDVSAEHTASIFRVIDLVLVDAEVTG